MSELTKTFDPAAIEQRWYAHWEGEGLFRPDVYGWDDEVARALGLERGPPRSARQHQPGDVGP